MGIRHRWRPARALLGLLLICSISSAAVLCWGGWALLRQERAAEEHEQQQQAAAQADRVQIQLRDSLAAMELRIGDWISRPPLQMEDTAAELFLVLEGAGIEAYPRQRLLYYPPTPHRPEAGAERWAEAERLEYQEGKPEESANMYRRMAKGAAPEIRAAALLRLGRVSSRIAQTSAALEAYQSLEVMEEVQVAGVPAALVAGMAMAQLLFDRGRTDEAREQAASVRRALQSGRWRLSQGQLGFYWSETGRVLGDGSAAPDCSLSEAVGDVSRVLRDGVEDRGVLHRRAGGKNWLVVWRRMAARTGVVFADPAFYLKPYESDGRFRLQLRDAEGVVVAGEPGPSSRPVIRMAAETGLPWTLMVTAVPASDWMERRERFLKMILLAGLCFIALATWLMARLILREAAVARLQSDFVSAVSHEFRSPLTAMRHLSEMLALGRVEEPGRRQRYYETLTMETRRLQRLVETLLNFGRMEAGAETYRLQRIDAAAVVRRVAAEFEGFVHAEGRRIVIEGCENLWVDADEEALALALRNLIDNALKYSPGQPNVWVECFGDRQRVAIRVRDQGAGIGQRERKLIFSRFVRGSAAGKVGASGTGVGLAMVQHIVHAHGGQIELESEPGVGSTFSVLLPAAKLS